METIFTKEEYLEKMKFVALLNDITASLIPLFANSQTSPQTTLSEGYFLISLTITKLIYEIYFPCVVDGVLVEKPQ